MERTAIARAKENVNIAIEAVVIIFCAFATFTFICFFGFVFWYINTEDNPADMLTKPLALDAFDKHRRALSGNED